MTKSKNPLYVVSKDGIDVESATNYVDLIIKKFGLAPYIDLLDSLIAMITNQVGNYGFFIALQELVDQIASQIEMIYEMLSQLIPSRA